MPRWLCAGRSAGTVLTTGAVLLSACGGGNASPSASPARDASGTAPSEVVVFAAASLTEVFGQIAETFEQRHPGTHVTFNFGPSSGLAAQIEEGAPADVFASADEANMKKVADAGRVEGPSSVFARNRLEIAVPEGNPRNVRSLADLARPGMRIVLAAPQVPVGRYGAEAIAKAGVTVEPVSLETDVKAVATKVALGEADAGIVYRTDVTAAADRLDGVTIPDEHNVVASYPVARLSGAPNPQGAAAFVDLLLSEVGRNALAERGFLAPAG